MSLSLSGYDETAVAADAQRPEVRRLAGVGEWGPGEEVLCAQRAPSLGCLVSLLCRHSTTVSFHIRTVAYQVIKS